jgi:hypothetical protein
MTAVSDPPSATVVLDGEIDIATAPAIRRFLMAAISGGDVHLAAATCSWILTVSWSTASASLQVASDRLSAAAASTF